MKKKNRFEKFKIELESIIYEKKLPELSDGTKGLCSLFFQRQFSDYKEVFGVFYFDFTKGYVSGSKYLSAPGKWSEERLNCVLLLYEFFCTDMKRLKRIKKVWFNYAHAA